MESLAAVKEFISTIPLAELDQIYSSLPLQWVFIGHSLYCASMLPELRKHYLLHYWVTMMAAFAGGCLAALIMMNPKENPIGILASNMIITTWTLCWWIMNYSPWDIVHKVHSFLPVRLVTKAFSTIGRCLVIYSQVNLAVVHYPGVYLAPFIVGTLACTGGKLMVDLFRYLWHDQTNVPDMVVPGFVMRSGMIATTLYYVLVHVLELITKEEGRALLITALVAHSILSDLVGQPLDFTLPIFKAGHVLTLIPMPIAGNSKAKPAAGKQQAAPTQATTRVEQPSAPAAPAQSAMSTPAKAPAAKSVDSMATPQTGKKSAKSETKKKK